MTKRLWWQNGSIKNKDKYIHYFEYNEFSEIIEIGKGDFGKVSKANLANTGLIVLKSFVDEYSNIEEDELNKFNDEFVKELEILRKIGYHKNIIRIIGRDWNRKLNLFKIFLIDDQPNFESVSNFNENNQHLAGMKNYFGVRDNKG
ncbi:hypothetical protein RhiirA1_459664 [Rhizophagus irregularis]|uniref:Protein kinase domain-containing protein n=1 Tax=Rhizophagus irregularis TaxID=588596 RepID=A0A2N0RT76_9GLOM|nr:hypothetical protein RhiirA1_459664 [Rhizophagus irregularis]